ncbi:MAG: dihydrodipicolinate synthase family protein [Terriglobales bacterium]
MRSILVSCEIPWDERDCLLDDVFRMEVRKFLSLGFRNLYIFGTAGEGYAVDASRFRQIAQMFHEETRGEGVRPQVGVIGLSTLAIRERIDVAFELGFREFQISLPCWGALNDRELLRFFKDVCLAYPEARFLHYNLLRTKRLLTAADYRKILDEVPNLVATKNTSPDVSHTAALMRDVPEVQHFFGEASFPTGCLYGECSLLSSFAPLFPAKTLELFEHACAGQIEALFQSQKEYLSAVYEVIAPMLREPLMDGAYDKALVRLGGLPMPLRLLSPYEGVREDVFLECQRILRGRENIFSD